jgi:prepilin-type processing-associated H-X9-DG protein
MRHFTIQRLMLTIAVVAVVLGGFIGLARMADRASIGRVYSPRAHCQSNLRNIAFALLGYLGAQEGEKAFPNGTWPNPSLPPEKRLSWYAVITPYLDHPILDAMDRIQPWDNQSNDPIACTRIELLVCPIAVAPQGGRLPTPYIGIAGLGTDAPFLPKGHPRAGVFGYERGTTLAEITDGAAYTMIVVESARVRGSWLAGGPATVRGLDTAELPYIGRGQQFGGVHPSGMNAAFADGSVRFVNDTINPRVLEALSTIAGGETVPQNSLD